MTPFDAKNIKQINQNICNADASFSEKEFKKVSNNAKDFIKLCLEKD